MRRLAQAALAVVVLLSVVAALAVPYWYWAGGLIEIESTQFVRQYLDNRRSTLQKIFDPHANDLGTYQARELSYFADYLDARVFEATMLADRPVFVPASALAAAAISVLLCVMALRRLPAAAKLPAALVLLVYVTNYVHLVTMGMLYRSAKPLLAPVLMATVFYLFAILSDRPRSRETPARRRFAPLVVFVLFSVMSLLDRQGFFYAVTGCLVLALHAVLVGGRRDALAAGAAAVGTMLVYNFVLGPMLVERINGYSPSFEYQRIPWQNLFAEPGTLGRAAELVFQSIASLLGGAPPAIFALGGLLALLWMFFSGRIAIALGILFVVLVQTVLVALMVARHPPIYVYFDHRVWYYPIPFQAVLVALLVVLIGRVVPTGGAARAGILSLVLAAIAVSNVMHWDDYRRAQLRSHWFPDVYMQTAELKASFADGRPRPSLSPEFFEFFEFWRTRAPALRDRAARAQGGSGRTP